MKSWMNKSILMLSLSTTSTLVSGCLSGENQTFFDYNTSGSTDATETGGTTTNSEATVSNSTGTNTDGTTIHSDDSVTHSDGTVVLADGTTVTTSGTSTSTTTGTSSSTSTGTASGTGTGTGTSTDTENESDDELAEVEPSPTPDAVESPVPGYGLCCNINSGKIVQASSTGCDHGLALYPVSSQDECNVMVAKPKPHVCDGFQNGQASNDLKGGIKANMSYYSAKALAEHPYKGVDDFFTHGTAAGVDFYFDQLNTPTRAFDSGFVMSDGSLLSNSEGTVLYEHFAFRFTGKIQLPAGAANKKVQFAILSDDGAILTVNDADRTFVNVNNDGNHPTRMACGATPVTVSADRGVNFELKYYQGPRKHIALILLWREWNGSGEDSLCGKQGNSYFFDSTTSPSTPLQPWKDLMNRWEVVPADVFKISNDESNPCH